MGTNLQPTAFMLLVLQAPFCRGCGSGKLQVSKEVMKALRPPSLRSDQETEGGAVPGADS